MYFINKLDIRNIVTDLLFENQINEKYAPESFTDSKQDLYNRPGPSIDGENKYEKSFEAPISADDFISVSTLKRNTSANDKSYSPDNRIELKSAFVDLINQYDNSEVDREISNKIWQDVTDILDKVR
jgi:hypothetical protein